MNNNINIIWDDIAFEDLKNIYEFNSDTFSIEFATKIRTEILDTISNIHFSKQWQIDDIIQKPYRRMIVRHYKIIYISKENELQILRIFDSRQDPKNFLK